MRTAILATLLLLAPGCAAQTPLACDGMGYACEAGHYLPRGDVDAACTGSVGCWPDGTARCTVVGSGPPMPSDVHRLLCTNGTVSDVGP